MIVAALARRKHVGGITTPGPRICAA